MRLDGRYGQGNILAPPKLIHSEVQGCNLTGTPRYVLVQNPSINS